MLKLFAVLLGGRAEGCNTELHDVVFTVGRSLEETYPKLVNKWFGIHKRLHIDASIELKFVDGHEMTVSKSKLENNIEKKLFFVNFGGYKQGYFGEIHEASFYVASSKSEALARAKRELGVALLEPHCDDNVSIDDIIALENIDQHYIFIDKALKSTNLNIECYYRRLDLPHIIESAKVYHRNEHET